jgi:hypothetical protein
VTFRKGSPAPVWLSKQAPGLTTLGTALASMAIHSIGDNYKRGLNVVMITDPRPLVVAPARL